VTGIAQDHLDGLGWDRKKRIVIFAGSEVTWMTFALADPSHVTGGIDVSTILMVTFKTCQKLRWVSR